MSEDNKTGENGLSRREFLKAAFAFGAEVAVPSWLKKMRPPEQSRELDSESQFDRDLAEAVAANQETEDLLSKIRDHYKLTNSLPPLSNAFVRLIDYKYKQGEKLELGVADNFFASEQVLREFVVGPTQESKQMVSEKVPVVKIDDGVKLTKGGDAFTLNIYSALVKKDRGRDEVIQVTADESSVSALKNFIRTKLGTGVDFDNTQQFVHESVHKTDPGMSAMFQYADGQWVVVCKATESIMANNKWLKLLVDHPDFIDKYFFKVEGDSLHEFLAKGEINRIIPELVSISCTNYLFKESRNWLTSTELSEYPDIELAIRQQLATTVYGNEAKIRYPNGLNDEEIQNVRQGIGKVFLDNYRSNLDPEVSKALDELFKDNMKQFYSAMNPGNKDEFTINFMVINSELKDRMPDKDIQYLSEIGQLLYDHGELFWPDGKVGEVGNSS